MTNYIAYYRVSTQRQGDTKNGLEAQQRTVHDFIKAKKANLLHEFTEVESGKRNARPVLHEAIKTSFEKNATLVVSKLDRLSRDVEFLFHLKNTKVDFLCLNLPDLNTLSIGMYASFAEHEREEIVKRTKDGLESARRKGKVLGNPKNLTYSARLKGAKAVSEAAITDMNTRRLIHAIQMLRKSDPQIKLKEIAHKLNLLGYKRTGNKLTKNKELTISAVQHLENLARKHRLNLTEH